MIDLEDKKNPNIEDNKKNGETKAKLFLENFLVYGLGGVINKIVPLIMLPIVTRLMPNTDAFWHFRSF